MGIGALRRYHAPEAKAKAPKLEPGSLRSQLGDGVTADDLHAAVDAANAAKVEAEQATQAKAAREQEAVSVYPTIQAKGRRKTTAKGKVSTGAESEAEVEGQPATGDEGTSQAQAAAEGSGDDETGENPADGSTGADGAAGGQPEGDTPQGDE